MRAIKQRLKYYIYNYEESQVQRASYKCVEALSFFISMLVTEVLEVDRAAILDRSDNSVIQSKVEPDGKVATFIALHYQVVVSVVDLIERTRRIQVVHLIDESCPEVLFTIKSDSLDRFH